MPLVPNFLERLIFLRLNQAPAPVLDLFDAVAFRTVLAALRLGIFDALDSGALTTSELARRLSANEHGLTVLLRVLEPLGYLKKQGDRYANTAMTTKWMVSKSPFSTGPMFEYWGTMLQKLWGNLEESIRTGQPQVNFYEWIENEPETSHQFQTFMINIARLVTPEILGKVKVPKGARRLLDLGGGHAAYSVAFCRKYPELTATIIDSPQALNTARENVAAEKMQDRITLREGNFVTDDLGQGFDVVLVFNIVHGFMPEQNTALLQKAAGALKPGGIVVIVEQIASKVATPIAEASNALFGVSFLHLLGGNVYTFEEISGWLVAAGFASPQRINLFRAPGNSVIVGTLR